MPHRQGRPNESEIDDREIDPGAGADGLADPPRGIVRIHRQQGHHGAAVRTDVARVDAAVGTHEAVRRLGDQDAVGHPDDAARLAQDDFDLARIAVPALGERQRFRSRLDRGQVDQRALGLGHDLLGDHQDVVAPERPEPRRGKLGQPGRKQPRQVVAGPDLGDPVERDDGQPAVALNRHGRGRAARAPRP